MIVLEMHNLNHIYVKKRVECKNVHLHSTHAYPALRACDSLNGAYRFQTPRCM
jgi:hypothetical protein